MNIYGEKVILRAIEECDTALLLELINDPQTERMLGGSSFPVSETEQRKWMAAQTGASDVLRCIVVPAETADNSGVGTVILSSIDRKNGVAQIHIKLAQSGRGKGYGSDALRALTRYAFDELRLNCVYAEILTHNDISRKLFEKCGYTCEGELRQRVFKGGQYRNIFVYSRLRED